MVKRSLFRLFGSALLLGALAVPGFCGPKATVNWVQGYEAGIALAKSQNKLAVVEFYTESCGWCKEMDEKTFVDPTVVKLSKQFVMVRVNGMVDRRAAIRYGVRGYPTVLVLDRDEKEVTRITGYRHADDLKLDLKEVLENAKKEPKQAAR